MPVYTRTYSSLSWASLDPSQHAKTCGYWYVVHSSAISHTAFRTREAFLAWVAGLGLSVDEQAIPQAGTWAYGRINGEYNRASHVGVADESDPSRFSYVGGYDEFFALRGPRVRMVDNGRTTTGIITTDEGGIKTIHHLNCNMGDRPDFPHNQGTVF